jgi:hypothetical protein
VYSTDPEYSVINLRSIVYFLVVSDLYIRLKTWL